MFCLKVYPYSGIPLGIKFVFSNTILNLSPTGFVDLNTLTKRTFAKAPLKLNQILSSFSEIKKIFVQRRL